MMEHHNDLLQDKNTLYIQKLPSLNPRSSSISLTFLLKLYTIQNLNSSISKV